MSDEFKPVSVKKRSFLDEEPDYDHLDVTHPSGDEDDDVAKKGETSEIQYTQYILGTLLVRLVAARCIRSVQKKSGMFDRYGRDGGSTNAFGEISFLGQTQRTSQIYDSVDPSWPRNEEYYFDVSLPVPKLAAVEVNESNNKSHLGGRESKEPRIEAPKPILSVCLMHTEKNKNMAAFQGKGSKKGKGKQTTEIIVEEEPVFIGYAFVDLRPVITGQIACFDQWLPLRGGDNITGEVRIVCEYDPSDPPVRPGDRIKLNGFSRARDLFPIATSSTFLVDDVQGDEIVLSYTSPEGWLCTFQVHRYMIICAERHQAALELYQDQILEIAEKLKYSPIVNTVRGAVDRLPDEGLVNLGVEVATNGFALLARWFDGGIDTVVGDIVYATNLDGSHLPGLSNYHREVETEDGSEDEDEFILGAKGTKKDVEGPDELTAQEPLPGMPPCPITGQLMRDPGKYITLFLFCYANCNYIFLTCVCATAPFAQLMPSVVAGDGHTYERVAITRWLQTSDISPLTGSRLPHKELVPNYLLISSLSAASSPKRATPNADKKLEPTTDLSLAPADNKATSMPDEPQENLLQTTSPNGDDQVPDVISILR